MQFLSRLVSKDFFFFNSYERMASVIETTILFPFSSNFLHKTRPLKIKPRERGLKSKTNAQLIATMTIFRLLKHHQPKNDETRSLKFLFWQHWPTSKWYLTFLKERKNNPRHRIYKFIVQLRTRELRNTMNVEIREKLKKYQSIVFNFSSGKDKRERGSVFLMNLFIQCFHT